MLEPERPVEAPFPWTGTVQGIVQGVLVMLLMLLASSFIISIDSGGWSERTLGFWCALTALPLVLLGLGIAVDLRRVDAPLSLSTPRRVRYATSASAIVFAALPALASGHHAQLPCALFLLAPLVFVFLDRTLGPAWVLGLLVHVAWRRRGWQLRTVLESDRGRAVLEEQAGATVAARTELELPRGTLYVEIVPLSSRADPYRDEARVLVTGFESAAFRAARARGALTAALALLSGLSWAALPLALVLGHELAEWHFPPYDE